MVLVLMLLFLNTSKIFVTGNWDYVKLRKNKKTEYYLDYSVLIFPPRLTINTHKIT